MRDKTILATFVMAFGLAHGHSIAAEISVSGMNIHHSVKQEMMEVGDVPEHFIAVHENEGVQIWDDGQTAKLHLKGYWDYTGNYGTYKGYVTLTFDDESSYSYRYEGGRKEGDETSSGKHACYGGTGRFAGIKCSMTSTFKNYDTAGVTHWEMKYTLPE